jgi:hypothetical protein
MTVTTISAKTNQSSTGVGTVASTSISGVTGDWTLVLEILGADSGVTAAQIDFETSTNAFSAILAGPVVSFVGQVSSGAAGPYAQPKRYSFKKEDFPGLPFGTASAVLRANLVQLTGGNVTWQAFLEY